MLKEFFARLRYRVERLFVNETSGQLMLLLFLVGLSTIIGLTAQFVGLFSAENQDVASIPRGIDSGFWDALWWTLQRVLYLSRLETVYGGTTIIVLYSIFLTLVGILITDVAYALVDPRIEFR